MPYFMVYVSSATTLFLDSELDEILAQSHENNSRWEVSGMLLYKGGNLMQVLEGDELTVRALYNKIAADRRHKGLLIIHDGFEPMRQFPDWSMAFRDLDRAESQPTPGYSEFMNTPLTDPVFASDPTACQRLLTMFKASM